MRKRVMLLSCRSASIFVFLSLAFGSIIIFANPPLRGPDEIAHFLRIYSYARGELLPVMEINARKGIFVSPGLSPIDTDHVRGVQGRYFVIALPVTAVFIAALVNRELPRGMPAAIAIAGSMIAGITTVEAVLRGHW